MYLVVRRLNGVEKTIGRAQTGKLAAVLRDCMRFRKPTWDVAVVYKDNPPPYDPVDALRMDQN